jgi:uncharacterized delta-60 repeat protein
MFFWRNRAKSDLDLLKYSRRKRRRGFSFQALGWGAFTVSLGGVLAAAITINTNGLIEFGQGSVRTIVCDRNVDISPVVTFDSALNEFTAEALQLSNLNNNIGSGDDAGCGNKTLIITVYSPSDPGPVTQVFQKKLFIGPGTSLNYQELIPLLKSNDSLFASTEIGNITIEQQTVAISGSFDTSFNSTGIVETIFSSGENIIFDLALQSNGKIVAVGVDNFAIDNDFAIARYLSDGTLDTTFNSTGLAALDLNSNNDDARATAIQSNGKIVVAGYTTPGGGDFDFALVRLNSNGTLDSTFGNSGITILDINNAGADDLIYDIALDSQDRIIAVGRTQTGSNIDAVAVRFSANGALDTSFGTSGVTRINSGASNEYARSIKIDSGGNLWIAGYKSGSTYLQPAIWKLSSAGVLDTEWSVATGAGDSRIQEIIFAQDGNIVAVGDSLDGSNVVFTAWKLDPSSGSLVSGFGTSGVVTHSLGSGDAFALAIASARDGKLILGGQAIGSSNEDFALARISLADGSLDTSFADAGIKIAPIGSNEDLITSLLVQSDGWIIAGGYADNNVDKRNFAIARFR